MSSSAAETNYHRAGHLPWNLIADITRGATERLAVGVDARRLIQRATGDKTQRLRGMNNSSRHGAASNAAESSTLVRENIEHSCTHLLRAIINLETGGIIASVMRQWGRGDEIRDLALLYWLCRCRSFFFSPFFSFFFFFILSVYSFFIFALKSAERARRENYFRIILGSAPRDARQISQTDISPSSFLGNYARVILRRETRNIYKCNGYFQFSPIRDLFRQQVFRLPVEFWKPSESFLAY